MLATTTTGRSVLSLDEAIERLRNADGSLPVICFEPNEVIEAKLRGEDPNILEINPVTGKPGSLLELWCADLELVQIMQLQQGFFVIRMVNRGIYQHPEAYAESINAIQVDGHRVCGLVVAAENDYGQLHARYAKGVTGKTHLELLATSASKALLVNQQSKLLDFTTYPHGYFNSDPNRIDGENVAVHLHMNFSVDPAKNEVALTPKQFLLMSSQNNMVPDSRSITTLALLNLL